MKEFVIQALAEALILLEKRVPKEKTEVVTVNISDVNPFELAKFIKENNIPETAHFSTSQDDTYAVGMWYEPVLSYDKKVPTTEKEQLKYKKDKYNDCVFPILYKLLTANGYKRKGFNSGLLADFKDTTVYDMYINNDIERLMKYYSIYFEEIKL